MNSTSSTGSLLSGASGVGLFVMGFILSMSFAAELWFALRCEVEPQVVSINSLTPEILQKNRHITLINIQPTNYTVFEGTSRDSWTSVWVGLSSSGWESDYAPIEQTKVVVHSRSLRDSESFWKQFNNYRITGVVSDNSVPGYVRRIYPSVQLGECPVLIHDQAVPTVKPHIWGLFIAILAQMLGTALLVISSREQSIGMYILAFLTGPVVWIALGIPILLHACGIRPSKTISLVGMFLGTVAMVVSLIFLFRELQFSDQKTPYPFIFALNGSTFFLGICVGFLLNFVLDQFLGRPDQPPPEPLNRTLDPQQLVGLACLCFGTITACYMGVSAFTLEKSPSLDLIIFCFLGFAAAFIGLYLSLLAPLLDPPASPTAEQPA